MEQELKYLWGIIIFVGLIAGLAVSLGVKGVWLLAGIIITSFLGTGVYTLISEKRYSFLETWFIMSIFSIAPMLASAVIFYFLLGNW